jgi:ferrochelatase
MKYRGSRQFEHGQPDRSGVLLVNLGTPDAPTPQAVRRYLAEFLGDPRVVEMPRLLWLPILHGVILNVRPRRSARAYRQIWTDEGSPLLAISRRIASALQSTLEADVPGGMRVELAMRYGRPSIAAGLDALGTAGVRRLLVLPLYPQYSATTSGSIFDAIVEVLKTWRWVPELRTVMSYHDEPSYIAAIAGRVRAHWREQGRGDHLLISFHGLPEQYLHAGDPYHCHCHKTARLIAGALALAPGEWTVTFQSRFGPKSWLKPYTEATLTGLAAAGTKTVDVVCPGFPADCLETLEEISLRGRDHFIRMGGKALRYIPALNDGADHVAMLAALVRRHLQGWPAGADTDVRASTRNLATRAGAPA